MSFANIIPPQGPPQLPGAIHPFWDLIPAVRRKVFVSYQHSNDQWAYNAFRDKLHLEYETIEDNSLRQRIDSRIPEYVITRIRDLYITGSSCTVVLCGETTHLRKFVDWEIKATLEKEHGLILVQLESAPVVNGRFRAPDRLEQNVRSGYAVHIHWTAITAHNFRHVVEDACSRDKRLIKNPREIMSRNA